MYFISGDFASQFFTSDFQGAGFLLTAYTQPITDGKKITSIGAYKLLEDHVRIESKSR